MAASVAPALVLLLALALAPATAQPVILPAATYFAHMTRRPSDSDIALITGSCGNCALLTDLWWCASSRTCLSGANYLGFGLKWKDFADKCPGLSADDECPASGVAIWGAQQCPPHATPYTSKCLYSRLNNLSGGMFPYYPPDAYTCAPYDCCELVGNCPLTPNIAPSASPIARASGAGDVVFSIVVPGSASPLALAGSPTLSQMLRAACAALLGASVDRAAVKILAIANASDVSAMAIAPGAAGNSRRILQQRVQELRMYGGGGGGSGRRLSPAEAALRVDLAIDTTNPTVVSILPETSVANALALSFNNEAAVAAAFSGFGAAWAAATQMLLPPVIALSSVRGPNAAFSATPSTSPALGALAPSTPGVSADSATNVAVIAAALGAAVLSTALALRFFVLWRRAERTLPLPYGLDEDERAAAEASVPQPPPGGLMLRTWRQPAPSAPAPARPEKPRGERADSSVDGLGSAFDCAVCLFVCDEPVVGACGAHTFCRACLRAHIAALKARGLPSTCPVCRGACQGPRDRLIVNVALAKAIEERRSVASREAPGSAAAAAVAAPPAPEAVLAPALASAGTSSVEPAPSAPTSQAAVLPGAVPESAGDEAGDAAARGGGSGSSNTVASGGAGGSGGGGGEGDACIP